MGDYRKYSTKRECLFCAVLGTILAGPHLCNFAGVWEGSARDVALFLLDSTVLIVFWYHYLAYDKKKKS